MHADEVGNENVVMLMSRTRSVVWLYFSKMSEKEAQFLPRLDLNFPWEAGGQSQYSMVSYVQISYSGKYLWDPNFVLFVLSLSEQKFNTQNDGCVLLCKMDRTKIKHTNQLEITDMKHNIEEAVVV